MKENSKDRFDQRFYEKKSSQLRCAILDLIYRAKKGHIGGAYSCIDLLTAIYYSGLFQLSPQAEQDHFLLSKGHCAAALYAVLHDQGFLSSEELLSYGTDGTLLGAHPDYRLQGIPASSGSLGIGLGIGAGMAFAKARDGFNGYTIVLTGDGECYEGSIWEAAMFSAHHKLNKLIWLIDRNGLCVLDRTEDCNRLEPLREKLCAFGWETQEIQGHDFAQILSALQQACEADSGKPQAIIAETVKGKGVAFMEGQRKWHHKVPNSDEYEQAKKELLKGFEGK